MKTYGYCRISTTAQNADRQVQAMLGAGIPHERIFVDARSGQDFLRPAWRALSARLRAGDLLFVASLDRLGRSYADIVCQWQLLASRKVGVVVMDMPLLDTRVGKNLVGTLIADIVLQVLSFAAQHEREMIRSRQAEGIAAAHARGVKFGRAKHALPVNFAELAKKWHSGKLRTKDLREMTGMSETTLYRRLREWKQARGK